MRKAISLAASLYFILNPISFAQEKEKPRQNIESIANENKFKGHEKEIKEFYFKQVASWGDSLDPSRRIGYIKKEAEENPFVMEKLKETKFYPLMVFKKPANDKSETKINESKFYNNRFEKVDKREEKIFRKKYVHHLDKALLTKDECKFNKNPKDIVMHLGICGTYLLNTPDPLFKIYALGFLSAAEQFGRSIWEQGLKDGRVDPYDVRKLEKTISEVKDRYNPN